METVLDTRELTGAEIAIVGMACRFPGAKNLDEFWHNLQHGVDSITDFTPEELQAAGVDPALLQQPNYIRAASILGDEELFDAAFFGYSPREAEIMDPQQRLFLETCWQALEHAGYDPSGHPDPVGVYGGAKTSTYLFNIVSNPELFRSLDMFQIAVGNDLACLTTRVSYKLNLRGPSYSVHTACSTSLVAIHLACQSLLINECRMAVAGGVAVNVPYKVGYFYKEGGVLPPDGRCRAFDARAEGCIFGNGVGAVVLKRLEDALADGDTIHAIIKGSATNNDGALKASYTAPGVEGQTRVILEALAAADVEPETISYVETHGTGTPLGDPIELRALSKAFRTATSQTGFCPIGSVKTNLGHLETAAGVASVIKTALALQHGQIPPSLYFDQPNPRMNLAGIPFYVNTKLADWPSSAGPRRAGVSSFGIGSTNAHAILEEAPAVAPSGPSRPWQLLLLSAKTPSALDQATANLAQHLRRHPELALPDVAHTLQVGRTPFSHRRMLVCRSGEEAIEQLEQGAGRLATQRCQEGEPPVTFMFPGLGDHYVEMALGLYQSEATFKGEVDRCAELLKPVLGLDLRAVIYPRGTTPAAEGAEGAAGTGFDLRRMLRAAAGADDEASQTLSQTHLAQPALFVIEYALAQQLLEWGVRPHSLIGYSLGEYVAACLAGVLSLEDALTLVAQRAQLIGTLPSGAMLAVPLPEAEVLPLLGADLSLAAINGPALCVVSGPPEAVDELEKALDEREILCKRLQTTHAFHSRMMEPIVEVFLELTRRIPLQAPRIPYLSNVTGTWITAEQATDPEYWVRHLCQTVRFADSVRQLCERKDQLLLEVGPGQGLHSFVRQLPEASADSGRIVLSALRSGYNQQPDAAFLLGTLGKLWLAGVTVDWAGFYRGERRRRVPLPTYPFERQRYWIAAQGQSIGRVQDDGTAADGLGKKPDLADWFYRPVWQEAAELAPPTPDQLARHQGSWLIFADEQGLGEDLAAQLGRQGRHAVLVEAGAQFARTGPGRYTIDPGEARHYELLLQELPADKPGPPTVMHLWGVTAEPASTGLAGFEQLRDRCFYSLIFLCQAIGKQIRQPLQLAIVSNHVQNVTGQELLCPEKSTLLGPGLVIPQEYPNITCRNIDLVVPGEAEERAQLVGQLLGEVIGQPDETLLAYRDGRRWTQRFDPVRVERTEQQPARLREGGVYMITGGLGGIGLLLAEHLARTVRARLVLTRRSPFPERAEWEQWLATHPEQEATSAAIRRLQTIEQLGGEVLVASADVGSLEQMEQVVALARERFGGLHGVIHAAGTLAESSFKAIQQIGRAECEWHFQPKIYGLLVLEQALQGLELDFCLLMSSLSSILGGLGYVGYATANLFMDAFAQQRNRTSSWPWISVDWDSWHYKEEPEQDVALGVTLVRLAVTPAEGAELFERVLGLDPTRTIVVSTAELQPRIDQWVKLRSLRGDDAAGAGADAGAAALLPRDELERKVSGVWKKVLGVQQIQPDDNFFDLGGNSLIGLQLISEIKRELNVQLSPVALFEAPTVGRLVAYLSPEQSTALGRPRARTARQEHKARPGGERQDIAIIAMNGRFPGARTVDQFWHNLRDGVESITFFSDEELAQAGIAPAVLSDPRYVKARPMLGEVDMFDAAFFGYSPREAELMDPQQRLFLECAWEALELAGYTAETCNSSVGVFAGAGMSSYLFNLYSNPELVGAVGTFQTIIGNDKDSLTTRVSYKLNLKGPSFAVQTFCSTSLVAVHLACKSLLSGECDIAMAGGASIIVPERSGYYHEEGGFISPDGHIRAFDANAGGLVYGNGVGLVVLKRLDEALVDGDPVYAVIKGSAVNNDGSLKVGFTATSVEGQAEVIRAAIEAANVPAESIQYVETHGSGTSLGDPIEVAALAKAFGTSATGYCAIGSAKTNVGHLDRTAGVTGLIKAVLSLQHKQIPPSLHFETPNPMIDFAHSPFYVNTTLRPWETAGTPRRAGVNSLGLGGTNAHVILEEAPPRPDSGPSRPWQLLLLSAKTPTALERATDNLLDYLRQEQDARLADVAFTLHMGRRPFGHRRALVCRDRDDALKALESRDPRRLLSYVHEAGERPVVFTFSGLGGQYVSMAAGLYQGEQTFKEYVDYCAELLKPELGLDLRDILYPAGAGEDAGAQPQGLDLRKMLSREAGEPDEATQRLNQTALAHPALFVVEYALAQLLLEWGVRPQALIGYSIGEYVAACLAGVFSLEDALLLVARRAQMIQELPAGAMLAISLPEDEVTPLLGTELSLAALNGPAQSVVAGPEPAVEALEQELLGRGIACRRLQASHAFHSQMMTPTYEPFVELVKTMRLSAPAIPYLSNVTGTWITAEQATDPAYWGRHMCQTVRFADAMRELMAEPKRVFVEVGPGQTLSSLILQELSADQTIDRVVLPTLRHSYERQPDILFLLGSLGKLWLAGVQPDWAGFYAYEQRRRLRLPTYPFERQRYWIEPQEHPYNARRQQGDLLGVEERGGLFYTPSWKRSAPLTPAQADSARCTLIFEDERGLATALRSRLLQAGQTVVAVTPGAEYRQVDEASYTLNPRHATDYARLVADLTAAGTAPDTIVHLWSLRREPGRQASLADSVAPAQWLGFYSLIFLAQALESQPGEPLAIWAVSDQLHDISGHEQLRVEHATLAAAARVIAQEQPRLVCRSLDLVDDEGAVEQLASQISAEIATGPAEQLVAYRGSHRWVPTLEPVQLRGGTPSRLRQHGAYLIVGQPSPSTLLVAEYLARSVQARLMLISPSSQPDSAAEGAAETPGLSAGLGEALQALGAEVVAAEADLSDEQALRVLVEQLKGRFDALHGVILVADLAAGSRQAVSELTPAVLERCLESTTALGALTAALRGHELDFGMVLTSHAALAGGLGLAAAAAGQGLLERTASAESAWTVVNWTPSPITAQPAASCPAPVWPLPQEEQEQLDGIFAQHGAAQLIVAPPPGAGRWNRVETRRDTEKAEAVGYYPRPSLRSAYVAPRTETEQTIATIWEELLGVEQVGVHDSFLDLGGDSLLATRLISRLRDAFSLDLPMRLLFEASTVEELARAIEGLRAEAQGQELDALLALLENLSDEEAEQEILRRTAGVS